MGRKDDLLGRDGVNLRSKPDRVLDARRSRSVERVEDMRETRCEVLIANWSEQAAKPFIVSSGYEMRAVSTATEARALLEKYRQKWRDGGYDDRRAS